jgi:3-hydroxyisobutyrate dehydrogenase
MIQQQRAGVAVVGFGAMGTRMALRLVEHGYDVLAVDPSDDARTRAEELGIPGHRDLSTVSRREHIVVLVATGEQLQDTVRAGTAERDATGETWVLCSTVGPQAARDATAMLLDAGASVLDAPVTGGVTGAQNGTLRFLLAGASTTIERSTAMLSVLGTLCPVGARPGDGQSTKLVNQLCSSVHLAVAAEAVALAMRLGLDPTVTVDVLSGGSGASPLFDDRGPRMTQLDGEVEVLTRLAILAKDNGLVEREAHAYGAHVPLLKAAKQQYQLAAELGLMDSDDSQIIRTYLDAPRIQEPIR